MATIKQWLKTKFNQNIIIPNTLTEAVYDSEGNNLNQILKGKYTADTVSDEYNNEKSYFIGDYCIYNNKLFKCITDIENGEEFDLNKWELTSCVHEINTLKDGKDDLEIRISQIESMLKED